MNMLVARKQSKGLESSHLFRCPSIVGICNNLAQVANGEDIIAQDRLQLSSQVDLHPKTWLIHRGLNENGGVAERT